MTSNSNHNQHTELPPEDFTGIRKSDVAEYAAGVPAVTQSFKHVAREGIFRGTTSLLKLNQKTVLTVVVVLGLTQMTIAPPSSFARMVPKLLPQSPQLGK